MTTEISFSLPEISINFQYFINSNVSSGLLFLIFRIPHLPVLAFHNDYNLALHILLRKMLDAVLQGATELLLAKSSNVFTRRNGDS